MQYYTSAQVREMFLEFFKSKNHIIEPSAKLVPINDPSLLWINSGVSAIKKYFDGSIVPSNPRLVNIQRSLRTNDIENVGMTARHHTMFEMLGNFSIGDYFKEDAIKYAWEFLTSPEWIGFDVDKLYVTIFTSDHVAYDIWRNIIKLDDERIIKLDGNFWEIGSGPCGPNSEIFYDRGSAYDLDNQGLELLKQDLENDRYIEIWNIVFSEFNALEGQARNDYQPLPKQNIDTGMGLERLVSIIQNTPTNFETDLFMPIINSLVTLSNKPYNDETKKGYRIIVDHMRALTFALADGASISNEGRGYVLKRLLRRAARYMHLLGIAHISLSVVVEMVVANMKEAYPYLVEQENLIKKMIILEEAKFSKTLSDGLKLFNELVDSNDQLSGLNAFKLYDTYGFPIEIIEELCLEQQITFIKEDFNEHMQQQRQRAKAHHKEGSNMQSQAIDLINFKTPSQYLGYEQSKTKACVIGLFKDGQEVNEIVDEGYLILDKTTLYAASGGQISDIGQLVINNETIAVVDVIKAPNLQHLHYIKTKYPIKKGDKLEVIRADYQTNCTRVNHTTTHILHRVLKNVVGEHVNQAGSFVSNEYLRFDFNHFEKLSEATLNEIERQVNDIIFSGYDVNTTLMSLDQAKSLNAMALFDEKYQDEVRVVAIDDYSLELCGGLHASNTNQIGLFKIEKEESIGSGIRRIIAVTSRFAYQKLKDKELLINKVTQELNLKSDLQLLNKVVNTYQELKTLTKQINDLKEQSLALNTSSDYIVVNQWHLYYLEVVLDNVNDIKKQVDLIKNKDHLAIVVVVAPQAKNAYVVGLGKKVI
ncbi:MAG: alanine--tRNA ligase, partial [Bacilli bacterium]